MARQVLPIVGAIVGAYFGGPQGAQIGYAIGSLVGNAVDPQVISGPKLGEAGLQTSAEGVFRPIVLGTGAVKGNIICRGNRVVQKKREQQGKGGPVTETERVYWTYAIRLCEGPIEAVTRIWMDEKLVFDSRTNSSIPEDSANFEGRFRLYLGDETQLPDPDLEAFLGVGNTPAFRGTAYVVFPNFDLTDYRERIPDFRFEITTAATETPIDKLDYVPFPPNFFAVGGITEGDLFFADSVDENVDTPIARVHLFVSPSPPAYKAPARARVILDDETIVYDSGWLGDPSLQSALDDLLEVEAPELIGQIQDAPAGTELFQEIYPGSTIKKIYIWAARPDGAADTYGLRCRVDYPDDIPPGAQPFYPVPGTLILPDDTIVAAPWGPDVVTTSGGPVSLSSIVTAIHSRATQGPESFDVSELTDMVDGLVLAGDYTCADTVRTLMPLYFFDGPEYDDGSGYKIRYHKRGKPVVATLDINDLIEAPEKTVRASAMERARTFHLHYESPKVGYAPAKASVTRNTPDVKVVGEISFQVPVSYNDIDIPRQLANKLHKISWVEVAGEEEFTVGDNWLELIPSDNVGVFLREQLRRMRITQDQTQPGIQPYKMIADRQSAYTSSLTGVPLPEPTPPPPSLPGLTIEELMDIPALNENNDRLLWYRAMTGQTEAWYGAQGQIRRPSDSDFIDEVSFTQNTVMGYLLDPISPASQHYIDTTNIVRVQLYTDDAIEALTNQQFLSEGGSFALKNQDGTWEILQYRDVTDEGGDVFSLSYLARGRLNTNPMQKLEGSRFVLLDGVKTYDATTSLLNQNIDHRAVSFGTSPESAVIGSTLYTGLSQTEFPVAHLFLERDGAEITATTVPRHRLGTEDNPIRSVNWSGYRWIATDGVSVTTVDNQLEMASFDVTGWSSPITVSISQLNRFTGAGPTVSEQIQ